MEIKPDISVCTVVYQNYKALRGLLRSVYETADPVSFEIIVAEVGDGSASSVAADYPEVKFFELAGESPALASNHAMRLASGRYTALLNHDVIVKPGCLKSLVDFMDANPDVGIAAPRILNAYGKQERSARSFHTVFSLLGSTSISMLAPAALWRRHHLLTDWNHRSSREVDWLCGGVHLLRRELIDDIGLPADFPQNLRLAEVYQRAGKSGWHNFYVHEAMAIHPDPTAYDQELSRIPPSWAVLSAGFRLLFSKWL